MIFFMWEVNLELQKKIRRLMFLKYKKHKKIVNLSLACLFLYSMLVFLLLTIFCTIEFEISDFSKAFLFVFSIILLLLLVVWSFEGINNIFSPMIYSNRISNFWLKNIFVYSFVFCIAILITVVCFDYASMWYLFLLFLFMSICFFILCLINKKSISRNSVLFIYFLFYFIFLWPVVEASIDGIPIVAKIWKIFFSLSPFLLLLFRSSFTDFLWSGYLIRRWFKIKDSGVWNCPGCHWYIMKKPVRFCPHCWCDSWALDSKSFVHICKNCGSFMKIRETDFPNFCPHCGLAFKFKHPRTYS